ncbi:MAG: hypothetical protein Q9168_001507, partial [Polycauliona sp. 1 TL-2023]
MRVTLLALLPFAALSLSSVIPSKVIRALTDNAVLRPITEAVSRSGYDGLAKRFSGGDCHGVRVQLPFCPREANPQGSVTLDPSHPPQPCFRDQICCGHDCDNLNVVGPANKRDIIPEQLDSTIMENPNMNPLVKRQDPLPKGGQQVVIYRNGQVVDQKYAGL